MDEFQKIGVLQIPLRTKALLWDMDGVLIDSLGLDLVIVNTLLQKYVDSKISLERSYIKSLFAYDIPTFWNFILEKVAADFPEKNAQSQFQVIVQEYEARRQAAAFELNPGILETLKEARSKKLQQAVVSNNPQKDVREILENVGIAAEFDLIVGNDHDDEEKPCAKKPAPDTYLFAAKKLGIPQENCVVIEDSLLGIEAGKRAGCYTIGVATGGNTREEMIVADFPPDAIYDSLA